MNDLYNVHYIPDTEDPEILKKLDFVSPKAGVYRPANPQPKGEQNACVCTCILYMYNILLLKDELAYASRPHTTFIGDNPTGLL